jgi:hypothetical protein
VLPQQRSASEPASFGGPLRHLDLMVPNADAMSPLHGYGRAAHRADPQGSLALNRGPSTPTAAARAERLDQSEWGTSENNRRARFYSIFRAGRKRESEAESRARTVEMIAACWRIDPRLHGASSCRAPRACHDTSS